ncbi:hypothetical protein AbraIFM66950_011166 [Aspergillus brasiliensis]|nr:hypothetical protein AbraIFM66950_011166 [Aspergillus brasiliensis]
MSLPTNGHAPQETGTGTSSQGAAAAVASNMEEKPEPPLESAPQQQQQSSEPILHPLSHKLTQFYTISYLIFFAIFGTLARLGLQALTFYPGAPVVTGVLWANVGGSLLMGFFQEDRKLFREEWGVSSTSPDTNNNGDNDNTIERAKQHKTIKKTIPLYIGLTTGFCGCFTSFSSFIRDVFLALTNDLPNPSSQGEDISSRNGGYSFMALVAIILSTVSLSLCALLFGTHLAAALDAVTPTVPFRFTRRVLDPLMAVLGWGCWLGAVFMAIWPPDRHSVDGKEEVWRGRAVFAIVFAPVGCLLRFYLSLLLNARVPSFPVGTFTVNVFGTVVLAMCFDLQHVRGIGGGGWTGCQVLQGVMDGFCGSATTISTWVAELSVLGGGGAGGRKRWAAYVYGVASVGVALGFVVVIVGSLGWTRGFDAPVCG